VPRNLADSKVLRWELALERLAHHLLFLHLWFSRREKNSEAKLAQEEKNAAAAPGLPGPPSGAPPAPPDGCNPVFVSSGGIDILLGQTGCKRTSSGAPSVPPPPPPLPFADGTEPGTEGRRTRLRGKTGDSHGSAGAEIPNAKTEISDDQYANTLSCLPRAETVVFDPRAQVDARLEELSDTIRKHPTVLADSLRICRNP
jgi:hypothetical protein